MGTIYLNNYDHTHVWARKIGRNSLEVRLYELPIPARAAYAALYKSAREVGKFDIITAKKELKEDRIQYTIGEEDLFPGRIIKIMLKKIDRRYNPNNETVYGVAYIKYDPNVVKQTPISSKDGYRLIKEEPQWWNSVTKPVFESEPEPAGPGM